MKIAALADIHGNYQALITVIHHVEAWNPDLVIVLGDIINRGPRSLDCLYLIQEKEKSNSWQVIKGNHEGYVLNFVNPKTPRSGPQFETRKIIYWTYSNLSSGDLQNIKNIISFLRNVRLFTRSATAAVDVDSVTMELFDYQWKIGETYRFLVKTTIQGNKTTYAAYFYLNEADKWKHLASFQTITNGEYLKAFFHFFRQCRKYLLAVLPDLERGGSLGLGIIPQVGE